jgi:hypothetical protein
MGSTIDLWLAPTNPSPPPEKKTKNKKRETRELTHLPLFVVDQERGRHAHDVHQRRPTEALFFLI